MAKIKCNHCKTKFTYKSKVSKHFDAVQICTQYNIKKIDEMYYCQMCIDIFSDIINKKEPKQIKRTLGGIQTSDLFTPTENSIPFDPEEKICLA